MFFVIVVCAYANFRLKKCFSYIVDVYLLVEKVENPDFTSSHMQIQIKSPSCPLSNSGLRYIYIRKSVDVITKFDSRTGQCELDIAYQGRIQDFKIGGRT
jgi:hypothetical protein